MTIGKMRWVQIPNGEGGYNCHGFLNAEAYSFRIYGRCLNDKEVPKNYEKTKDFHKLLVNGN